MVTIKQVAQEAGVSIATVSFYLNKKPVSEEKALRIEAAIRKLNYVVQSSGHDMRIKRNSDIAILFPNVLDPYYEKLINSIKGYLSNQGRDFTFSLSDDDLESESKALMRAIGRRFAGIILYTCQPDNAEVFRLLTACDIPFVLIDRKPEGLACNFVSCDNLGLFHAVVRQCLARGEEDIRLVAGPLGFNENQAAVDGFTKALAEANAAGARERVLSVVPTRENGFRAGVRLLENGSRPQAVLTTSYLLAEGLLYAFRLHRVDVGKETVIITSGDCVDDVFYYNPLILKAPRSAFDIGETASRLLLQNIRRPDQFQKQRIILPSPLEPNSFRSEPTVIRAPAALKLRERLNVLVLDDESTMYTLQRLMVDFSRREPTDVRLIGVHPARLYDHIMETLSRPDANIDCLLYDIPWLIDFIAKGFLLPLDGLLKQYQVNVEQYVPGVFHSTSRFNGHFYSLPYIATTQMLFYRRDLFHEPHLERQFETTYGLPLTYPRTWQDFVRVARFFTQRYNAKSPVRYGHAFDLYNPSLILCSLWTRLWALGGGLYDASGRLSLTSPPVLAAVRNLLECVSAAHPHVTEHPVEAVEKLLTGEVAMACVFINFATPIVDRFKASARTGVVGYANIPGGCPVMGGWAFAIPKQSRLPETAFRFIRWASGADIAIPHAILGGQSPHLSTYRNYDMLSLYPWLSKAQAELTSARTRNASVEHTHPLYLQERVESVIASELLTLIHKAISDDAPGDAEIERALRTAETTVNHTPGCRL
ncbi:MAG: extracellular solute-binding protein [Oscillospiraceae bacterium]|jgi:multiple sugar transport system substrate-binding protein|nr:extracellular solute-binding protein [Oscillospiraceae bacterium]